ncbi:MAG TPA: hypothetical protein VFH42_06420 [Sporolactobacillaceae bacterium]|nr:hypothetical protein [Sporolactobacillaceae bacterium]
MIYPFRNREEAIEYLKNFIKGLVDKHGSIQATVILMTEYKEIYDLIFD